MSTNSTPPQPPSNSPQIPGFRILSRLGEKASGKAWLAINNTKRAKVVLKVFESAWFRSDKARARFQKQLVVADLLDHPHIAHAYEKGIFEGLYYCTSEYIDGRPLDRYIAEVELDQRRVLELMLGVCDGVDHAHQRGIVHAGIKPSNIVVARDGRGVVVDFGLTRALIGDETDPGGANADNDDLAYLSPEQATNWTDRADRRADVYSLGAVLYTLLVGQPPHVTTDERSKILQRVAAGEYAPPRELNSQLDEDLEAILLKAMALAPKDRYESAGKLGSDIHNYLNGEPVAARERTVGYVLSKRAKKLHGHAEVVGDGVASVATRLRKPLIGVVIAAVVCAGIYAMMLAYESRKRFHAEEEKKAHAAELLARVQQDTTKERGEAALVELDELLKFDPATPDADGMRARILAAIGPRPGDVITNSLNMRFVYTPPGDFLMGSPPDEAGRQDDEIQHKVKLTNGLWIGAFEVTRGQFATFVNESRYKTDAEQVAAAGSELSWSNPGFEQKDNDPVVRVSWKDAVSFCAWLTRRDRRIYRLPTEAEWEHACRAGTTTAYPWGADINAGRGWANVFDGSYLLAAPNTADTVFWSDGYVNTSPVGSFKPNAWGLYDMIGNVAEWCQDGYGPYPSAEATDPQGTTEGENRVIRGASWLRSPGGGPATRSPGAWYRSAARYHIYPHDSWESVGFRIVTEQKDASPEPPK